MLHITEFTPAVGSQALLDGVLVKIHQQIDADTFLVLGDRITRRADRSELAPPPEPTLFDAWLARRTRPGSPQLVTPVANMFEDYRRWLESEGQAQAYPASIGIFSRQMAAAGHRSFLAFWREPGDAQVRTRRVYPLLLQPALSARPSQARPGEPATAQDAPDPPASEAVAAPSAKRAPAKRRARA